MMLSTSSAEVGNLKSCKQAEGGYCDMTVLFAMSYISNAQRFRYSQL